jgi:hypothetical protein
VESTSGAYVRLIEKLRVEIARAKSVDAQYHRDILEDRTVSGLLARYRQSVEDMNELNKEMGVPEACGRCAAGVLGGCCFQGIEEGYDHILLLMNLLMGCHVPDSSEIPGSCFFVGERGCKLVARFYFCLHYLCTDLTHSLGPSGIGKLLGCLGTQLKAGWELEQALRTWLKGKERDL